MASAIKTVIGPISLIRCHVEDQPELVYIDLELNSSSQVNIKLSESSEYSLPEQRITNPTYN